MPVLGELEVFRRALGHRLEEEEAQEALRLAGPATEELRSCAGGMTEHSRISRGTGVQLRCYDGPLGAVLFSTQSTATCAAYPRPDALLASLPGDASRADVRAQLGEPAWSSGQVPLSGGFWVRRS